MLNHEDKVKVLKAYLFDSKESYADSFKTDILFYFDGLDTIKEDNTKLNFLENLNSKQDIHNWVDNLTSKIVMKYNEEEEQLSDFIFYQIC